MNPKHAQVLVVGAGLAGLIAARELQRAGVHTVVLEARNRVGGRTVNYRIDQHKIAELGGQWIGPGQHEIDSLVKELGIDTFATYDRGLKLLDYRGRVRPYAGGMPMAGPTGTVDFGLAVLRLERMARAVSPAAPWQAPNAHRWDRQTFESWINRHTHTRFAQASLTLWTESVLAVDPADVSLLHVLAHASAHRGLRALASTSGGAQERRIDGGSQRICSTIADELADSVQLGQPVRRIEYDGTVRVYSDTTVHQAERVLVAMSPSMAAQIDYAPALPPRRRQLMHQMPMGAIAKCVAVYDDPFWRRAGLSGQALSDQGPVTCTFDNSPPDGTPGVLVGFIAGARARTFSQLAPPERERSALQCFTRWFGPAAGRPRAFLDKIWADDPWAGGGYFGYMPPQVWTTVGDTLTTAVGLLHWAGSETSGICMGSMDGAIRSGRRVAAEVTDALRTHSAAAAAE